MLFVSRRTYDLSFREIYTYIILGSTAEIKRFSRYLETKLLAVSVNVSSLRIIIVINNRSTLIGRYPCKDGRERFSFLGPCFFDTRVNSDELT